MLSCVPVVVCNLLHHVAPGRYGASGSIPTDTSYVIRYLACQWWSVFKSTMESTDPQQRAKRPAVLRPPDLVETWSSVLRAGLFLSAVGSDTGRRALSEQRCSSQTDFWTILTIFLGILLGIHLSPTWPPHITARAQRSSSCLCPTMLIGACNPMLPPTPALRPLAALQLRVLACHHPL